MALTACTGPVPAPDGPFALEAFFAGASRSEGEVRTALVLTERITASFAGASTENGLELDEIFHFPQGDRLQRWSLRAGAGGTYAGTVRTAGDDGELRAPANVTGYKTADGAVLDYDGYAPGGSDRLLHFRHWMTTQGDGTVLNRVRISKFGLPIAGARVVFSKVPPTG
ncbi:hypothetical protein Sa4125_41430 [Aureimonas sp. SA4125]|uniref:DUF3833 family protein n=1 Tax=Aureimonas sp. SA4125 TaxID=2826993 RepID=UPI001CC4578F|nr:DUF3833 family protein [Aureimonas sp. SA4125]BDA86601.1 hypothetical protein Sa4125_41430 [Aureimonas sp. SA4125]